MASLSINDELRRFAEEQAGQCGLRGAAEYVESLLQAAKATQGPGNGRSSGDAANDPAAAIADLERLRVGNRLAGLSLRELIEEGRRL